MPDIQSAFTDNIVWSPGGGAFLCEDGDGWNHVVALDAAGLPWPFARNALPSTAPANEEFTGACFSADGQFMFVNIQTPGITFAISGPFDPGPPPVIPEIPIAALLPATGLAVAGGLVAFRRRTSRTAPEDPAAQGLSGPSRLTAGRTPPS